MPTRPRDTKRQPIPSEVEERFLSLFARFSAFHVSDLCVDLHPLEESPPAFPLVPGRNREVALSFTFPFLPANLMQQQAARFLPCALISEPKENELGGLQDCSSTYKSA